MDKEVLAKTFWENLEKVMTAQNTNLITIMGGKTSKYDNLVHARMSNRLPKVEDIANICISLNVSIDYMLGLEKKLSPEQIFINDNIGARSIVSLMMQDESLISTISTLLERVLKLGEKSSLKKAEA